MHCLGDCISCLHLHHHHHGGTISSRSSVILKKVVVKCSLGNPDCAISNMATFATCGHLGDPDNHLIIILWTSWTPGATSSSPSLHFIVVILVIRKTTHHHFTSSPSIHRHLQPQQDEVISTSPPHHLQPHLFILYILYCK